MLMGRILFYLRLIVRVAVSPEPPPAKGCNLRFCPRWLRAITYKFNLGLIAYLSPTGICFSSSAYTAEHRLLRTPHAGGAPSFLGEQKRRQKTRRECDSPFLPASRRNGKSHIPGSAAFTRELSAREKAGDLIVRFFPRVGRPGACAMRALATLLRSSRGEASGPPAGAET